MTSAYSINLNFNNTIPVKTDFTFKQGDKGITLNLATTGLDTTGTTAKIVFKRSNGTSVEADLVGAGPTYSYTILGNEFEIPGVVVADLKLYDGDTQRVSTASFIFLVTGDTMDGVGGGTGGYSDQLEQLSQEFAETLEEYQDAFGDVGAINPRGEYSALEEYTALDLVSYNGSSYLCREGCTGIAPTNTTYWQVFASGGGGGTDDYQDLENKPSINGVELTGNKSTEELGLPLPGQFLELRNLGTYTAELKADIAAGTFKKVRVGDYFTINSRVYYVAHLDYWLHAGDTGCTTHHAVIVPAASLGFGQMNSSATTSGGYLGSDFKTGNGSTVLATIKATIEADFGASNILTHRDFFINSVSDGVPTAGVWVDSDVDLMNEEMVYGSPLSQPANTGSTNHILWTISKSQLELFQKRPDLMITGESWWLRDVVNSERFAAIFGDGRGAGAGKANNNNYGIRPAFGIC